MDYDLLDRECVDWAWPDIVGRSVCDESKFALDFFKNKLRNGESGYAMDFGATDGICHNNVFSFFNKPYYWGGLSIDANPRFDKQRKTLFKDTNVSVYCGAVSDIDGEVSMEIRSGRECGHSQLIKNGSSTVRSMKVNSLLEKYKAPNYIDFISMDIEGAESYVLNNWDWDRYKVKLWCIERGAKYTDTFGENGYKCLNPNENSFDGYKICHGNTFFVNENI